MKLAELVRAYVFAKEDEELVTKKRRFLAEQIKEALGHEGEGQKTYETDDGWKITVKTPMNRSMNWQQWENTKELIPEPLWPVELKPSLDEKGVKWLQNNDPETYLILSQCLTVKPGAVQITVIAPTAEAA